MAIPLLNRRLSAILIVCTQTRNTIAKKCSRCSTCFRFGPILGLLLQLIRISMLEHESNCLDKFFVPEKDQVGIAFKNQNS